jgi:transcription initiation factor TFIIB
MEHFDFSWLQKSECWEILERAKEEDLHSGKGIAPTTIAGCVLYSIVKKHRMDVKQREVADVVGTSAISIRNNYRDFLAVADNVPVSVLPPKTIDEALTRLDGSFGNFPAVYVDEAKDLLEYEDIKPVSSEAGVAGAAYLEVADDDGKEITVEDVSGVVGATPETIWNHRRRFRP